MLRQKHCTKLSVLNFIARTLQQSALFQLLVLCRFKQDIGVLEKHPSIFKYFAVFRPQGHPLYEAKNEDVDLKNPNLVDIKFKQSVSCGEPTPSGNQ